MNIGEKNLDVRPLYNALESLSKDSNNDVEKNEEQVSAISNKLLIRWLTEKPEDFTRFSAESSEGECLFNKPITPSLKRDDLEIKVQLSVFFFAEMQRFCYVAYERERNLTTGVEDFLLKFQGWKYQSSLEVHFTDIEGNDHIALELVKKALSGLLNWRKNTLTNAETGTIENWAS